MTGSLSLFAANNGHRRSTAIAYIVLRVCCLSIFRNNNSRNDALISSRCINANRARVAARMQQALTKRRQRIYYYQCININSIRDIVRCLLMITPMTKAANGGGRRR